MDAGTMTLDTSDLNDLDLMTIENTSNSTDLADEGTYL